MPWVQIKTDEELKATLLKAYQRKITRRKEARRNKKKERAKAFLEQFNRDYGYIK